MTGGSGGTGDGTVFAAWWCCSVGTTWTVELRSAVRGLRGRPLEWFCSGVPTEQPTPEQLLTDLLREHDLLLFPDDPVEFGNNSRRLIGFVTRDVDVMRLALALRHTHEGGNEHPLLTAAQMIHDWRTTGSTRPRTRPKRPGLSRKKMRTVGLDDKIENQADVLKGKAKEAAGRIGEDPALEVEGQGDQAKGHVKQAGEKLKDAAKDIINRK